MVWTDYIAGQRLFVAGAEQSPRRSAWNFTGITATFNASTNMWDIAVGTGSGGHVVEDEGTPLTQRANLNFVGVNVSVADSGGKTVVTIGAVSLVGSQVTGTLPYTRGGTGLGTLGTAGQQQRVNAGATAIEWFTPSSGSGGMGFRFTYSTTTTDSDPGAGTLRGNNATLSSVTQLYVDLAEYGTTDVTAWLDSFDDYAGAIKGMIRLQSLSDATKWIEYTMTAWTTASGYRKLTVAYKDGLGGLLTTAGDTFMSFDYATSIVAGDSSVTVSAAGVVSRGALTGDVTASAGSNATTIANDAVTYAKLQNGNGLTIVGRAAASAGDNGDITFDNNGELILRRSSALISATIINENVSVSAAIAGSKLSPAFTAKTSVTPAVETTGSPYAFLVTGAAHTTLTASAEVVDADFALNRTVQLATGALATQRAALYRAPTYGFVGASVITDAATLAITGAPVAGTNATITRAYALWIESGRARFDGGTSFGASTSTTGDVRTGLTFSIYGLAPGAIDQKLLAWDSSVPRLEIGQNNYITSAIWLSSANIQLRVGTNSILQATNGIVSLSVANFQFDGGLNGIISITTGSGGGATGSDLTVRGQNESGSTATGGIFTAHGGDATGGGGTGGAAVFRGGDATGGSGTRTGGNVTYRPGSGANAGGLLDIQNGAGTSRIKINDTGLGFFAATPIGKPTVTGSRGGNAALASALAELANLGLITDSSSA